MGSQLDNQDLVVIGKVLKKSAESIKTEINLLNELPRRNVFVDRKVRYQRTGDKYRSCYFILTQIGNSRFEAQRTIEEFQSLYSALSEMFTPENFPKHPLPLPLGLLGGDSEGNLSENLQNWFEEVLKSLSQFEIADDLQMLCCIRQGRCAAQEHPLRASNF